MTAVVITETSYTEKDLATFFPASNCNWVLVRTVKEAEEHPGADLYLDLDFINEESRTKALSRLLPATVLVNAVTPTLQEIGFPFVRINGWPGFLERTVHELAITDQTNTDRLTGLYAQLGHNYRIVPDTPGMISGRILATIINEAYYTWEEKVSTKEEIDTAMKLGTNYPWGPFEWSQLIGLKKIAHLLVNLSRQNTRYTPANSLLQAANELKYD